jgi:hypothetical protein
MTPHKRQTAYQFRKASQARHRQTLNPRLKATVLNEVYGHSDTSRGGSHGIVERLFRQIAIQLYQEELSDDQWELECQQNTIKPEVCWEIIQITLDGYVVDDWQLLIGRPTLTCCLDRANGHLLGYALAVEPFGVGQVLDCLLQTILTLTTGEDLLRGTLLINLPSLLILHQLKVSALDSEALDAVCNQLGMVLEVSEQESPLLQCRRQRLKHALEQALVAFSLSEHLVAHTTTRGRKHIKSYPFVEAVMLEQAVKTAFESYDQTVSQDEDETPAQLWEGVRQAGSVPRALQRIDIEILLSQQTTRTMQRLGVRLHGLWYTRAELLHVQADYGGESVIVKYLPTDLSHVYIFDPSTGSFVTTMWADDERYTRGLSLWSHEAQRRRRLPSVLWIDNATMLATTPKRPARE